MSWSLSETGALALKAARGAGMTWGFAEEVSEAIKWLQGYGLPGVAALCRYLSWYNLQKSSLPEWSGASREDNTYPYCPLSIGIEISDGLIQVPSDTEVSLGLIRQPLLLLPFVSNSVTEGSGLYAEDFCISGALGKKNLKMHSDFSDTLLLDQSECFIRPLSKALVIAKTKTPALRLPDCYGGCIEVLDTFATRIYAPSTELSRSRGAGTNSITGD